MHRYIPLHFWSINIANKFLNQKYSIFVIRIFPDQKLFAIIPLFPIVHFVRSALAGNGNSARIIAHRQQRRIPSFCMHTVIPPIVNGKSILLLLSIHPLLSAFFPFLTSNLGPKRGKGKAGRRKWPRPPKLFCFCWLMCGGYARKEEEMGKLFMRCLGPTNTQNSLGTKVVPARQRHNGIGGGMRVGERNTEICGRVPSRTFCISGHFCGGKAERE
jgi:hypothetical protein